MDRLTATGLAFQTMAAAMYVDRATIYRRTAVKVGLDTSYTRTLVASAVPVRLASASASERQVAGATQGSTAYAVRMPAWHNDAPLTVDSLCVLEIAARDGSYPAQTLHVLAPMGDSGTRIDLIAERQS